MTPRSPFVRDDSRASSTLQPPFWFQLCLQRRLQAEPFVDGYFTTKQVPSISLQFPRPRSSLQLSLDSPGLSVPETLQLVLFCSQNLQYVLHSIPSPATLLVPSSFLHPPPRSLKKLLFCVGAFFLPCLSGSNSNHTLVNHFPTSSVSYRLLISPFSTPRGFLRV